MGNWKPTTEQDLNEIIKGELRYCKPAQLKTWKEFSIKPYKAKIIRYGATEYVFIVAVKDNEAMYYEDVEEGFNFSPLGKDGEILEHWCNQDELFIALNKWTTGMDYHGCNLGPAVPVDRV